MPTFGPEIPLWTPRTAPSDEPVRHILDKQAEPGDTATALCGHEWKVRRIEGKGIRLATCDACLARVRA